MNKKKLLLALLILMAITVTIMASCKKTQNASTKNTLIEGTWKLNFLIMGGQDLTSVLNLTAKFDAVKIYTNLNIHSFGIDTTMQDTINYTIDAKKIITNTSIFNLPGNPFIVKDTFNVDTLSANKLVISTTAYSPDDPSSTASIILHFIK